MLNSFSAKMVAATSILTYARAQLPHQCFLVTEMLHSSIQDPEAVYVSDLPDLMADYQPGQLISSIKAYQDDDFEDLLTGL